MTESGLNETTEVDHESTYEIVCPYCGYEFMDSVEIAGEDGDELEETYCEIAANRLAQEVLV